MAEFLTKSRTRTIFCGGSVFIVIVIVGMAVHSHRYVVPTSTAWSFGLGCLIGLPATWYFARHIRHLMDVADKGTGT